MFYIIDEQQFVPFTSRATDDQRRNFLNAIILIRLKLNPEALFTGDIERVAYHVSIVITIHYSDYSGCLMISQIREIDRRFSNLLRMVILDAISGNVLISGQRMIADGCWSFYPNPISNEHRLLVEKMVMLMCIIEPMEPIGPDEFFDEIDLEDEIENDEEGNV
jgi:hypothetical protein